MRKKKGKALREAEEPSDYDAGLTPTGGERKGSEERGKEGKAEVS